MQATSPQEAPIQLVRNTAPAAASGAGSQRWQVAQIEALFALPFPELLFRAQTVHRANFDPTEVQLSTLLSIKTGGCAENCSYCPQSAAHDTGVEATSRLLCYVDRRADSVPLEIITNGGNVTLTMPAGKVFRI